MADKILLIAQDALRSRGAADADALASLSVAGEADGTLLIAHEDEIPTWRPRDYSTGETPVGKPYKWEGQVYKLWKPHDATGHLDWSPDKAVSEWDICHTTDPKKAKKYVAPQGTRGLWQPDECCEQRGHVWRCTVEDNAYGPTELPERWEDLGTIDEVQGVA